MKGGKAVKEVWLRNGEGLDLRTLAELVKLEHQEIRVHRVGKSSLCISPNGPTPVDPERTARIVPIRPFLTAG